jgi:membrane fusion protein (multidrug efflux system)
MNAVTKLKTDPETGEMEQTPAPISVIAAPEVAKPEPRKKRRGGRFLLMALLPLVLVVGGGYVWVTGGRYQETENANLLQAKVSIASEVSGRIVQADVSDNERVKAGQVRFVVDPEPYKIALAQADAALAAARIGVEQLRAAYGQAMAQERVAAGEIDYAQSQYDRAKELAGKGINTKSSLDEAKRDLDKAQEQHTVAKQGIASALAALGGDPEIETDKHPAVLSALAARDKAAYSLQQATVRAPADGVIAQASSFKVGQFVGAGTPLFSLVEVDDTWVEANFKETQLTRMKDGQKAEVTFDTYPSRTFEATVQSLGAGTGAEFSLLPAQNATGNWVKVTQRIPVKLKLDNPPSDLALATGMSAQVSVDTGVTRGLGGLFGFAYAAGPAK